MLLFLLAPLFIERNQQIDILYNFIIYLLLLLPSSSSSLSTGSLLLLLLSISFCGADVNPLLKTDSQTVNGTRSSKSLATKRVPSPSTNQQEDQQKQQQPKGGVATTRSLPLQDNGN